MSDWRQTLSALARQPVVHFVLLGGALFLLRAGLAPPAPVPPRPLPEIPAPAPPKAAPTDDDLLYREALKVGLDRGLVVRRRLVQNMRFLAIDKKASDDQLYRQARAIGFHRTDPVVRRFLVEQMRLLARAGTGRPDVFTEAEIARYVESHRERFMLPVFVRLTHVFLSGERRGKTIERDAERLLARLRDEHVSPEAGPALGDPFLLGHETGFVASFDLEPVYGEELAAEVMRLPVGAWSGPVRSVHGLHLIWIHETRERKLARLEDVRSQVVQALAEQRQEARLAQYLHRLRQESSR